VFVITVVELHPLLVLETHSNCSRLVLTDINKAVAVLGLRRSQRGVSKSGGAENAGHEKQKDEETVANYRVPFDCRRIKQLNFRRWVAQNLGLKGVDGVIV